MPSPQPSDSETRTPQLAPRASLHIRDRIRELRRVRAGELQKNPANWRTHPESQRAALAAMLESVGFAAAAIAYEPDPEHAPGILTLIDGHLRADLDPDAELPVLVLDVDDDEARQLLLTLDPLAAMAGADRDALRDLLEHTELPADADAALVAIAAAAEAEANAALAELAEADDDDDLTGPAEVEIPEGFSVVAACPDEASQERLYSELTGRGFTCKLLTT